MPPVRRHRIGDQMPSVIHPGPDPAALALCRDLVVETGVDAVILFGSRASGGWDEQSDLDMIIVHASANCDEEQTAVRRMLDELRERHYPGHRDFQSPHHGVEDGQMVETPEDYATRRRTLNHVMARAAREGRIFTWDPDAAAGFRHDGDASNEWELVTLEQLRRAAQVHGNIGLLRDHMPWYAEGDPPARRHPINVHTDQGRNAHQLLWNSGAALLSILSVIYPRDSAAEMATAISRRDAGWNHAFRSNLERIDQYSGCGCEVVVTDPIEDVPAMWRDLEADRDALWERIYQLSGYDLTAAPGSSGQAE